MPNKFFITGTDTEVGKTYISRGLLQSLKNKGYSVLGIKPVATGCYLKTGILYSDDALLLQNASSFALPYSSINPFAFAPAVSPNIAAKKSNQALTVETIGKRLAYALEYPVDYHIIEGIGGWCVPLNEHETMADFAKSHQLSIILVVSIKLGCLNHAILSYHHIMASKLPFVGWVANCLDERVLEPLEIIHTLKSTLKIPCLGIVNHDQKPAKELNVSLLF